MIKAVTKSGGNTFPGSLRTGLTDRSWTAETPFEIEEEIERESDLSQVDSATFGFRCPSDSASDRLQTVNRS